ncbi:DUF397 domain-containing protein [Streptomyces sp. NPDC049881]|uniref:DUF397 domain-containing protein n=1 Tax=Streptomyces sp. NPDC049881 TaxID=3155778 RepID=UPI003449B0D3
MTARIDLASAEWAKSSRSGSDGGQCVEFSRSFTPSGVVPVRDSKGPDGPVLTFSLNGWGAFLAVLRDEFPTGV